MLFSSVVSIIKGVYVFLNSNYRYTRVFKLLVHLGIRACLAVLPRDLYYCNLSLLKGPSCFEVMAFHKISVEFLFVLLRGFKKK